MYLCKYVCIYIYVARLLEDTALSYYMLLCLLHANSLYYVQVDYMQTLFTTCVYRCLMPYVSYMQTLLTTCKLSLLHVYHMQTLFTTCLPHTNSLYHMQTLFTTANALHYTQVLARLLEDKARTTACLMSWGGQAHILKSPLHNFFPLYIISSPST